MIKIFTRPVRSGKTTELINCLDKISLTKKVAGILMPDEEGQRTIMDIETKEQFIVECPQPESAKEELVSVGRFYFYKDVLDKANDILIRAASSNDVVVIDEIGKLELEEKGFFRAAKALINDPSFESDNKHLVLVVRDTLLEKVVSRFKIGNYSCTTRIGTLL